MKLKNFFQLVALSLVIAVLFMAAIVHATVIPGIPSARNDGYNFVTWEALAKNDTGSPVNAGSWRGIKTVQIVVTAAGEQNVTIQGSMSSAGPWFTLHAIELDTGEYFSLTAITTSMMAAIIEDPLFVRPLISNETGATAVDVDVTLGAIRN
jgi:hypothetical protein